MSRSLYRALGDAMAAHHRDIGFDHNVSTCGAGCAEYVLDRLIETARRPDKPTSGSLWSALVDFVKARRR